MLAKTGSQSVLCSMPFRYDTYRGCTHGCLYCFATKANKKFKTKEEYYTNIEDGDVKSLEAFLKKPKLEPYMENTPIHWGGMSDGFQPIEKDRRLSYQSLLLFAKYQYPVVISTKGIPIIASDEYIQVLKECKVVVQISMMNKDTEKWDRGTVGYKERLAGIKKLMDNGIPVVIRNQPYMVHFHKEVLEMIGEMKGVEGFITEGYKDKHKFTKGAVRIGGEYMYPLKTLFLKLREIKEECDRNNIRFFAGENRLRWLGEDVNCCGVAHIKGFESSNNLNVTQLFYHKYITFSNMGKDSGAFLAEATGQSTINRKIENKINKQKSLEGNVSTGSGTLVQDTIGIKALTKMNSIKGDTPTNGLVQDTIGSKALNQTNDTDMGFYNFLKYYVNNGSFAKDYELEAVGKDKNGNYVFEYIDKDIEKYRKSLFKA